MQTTEARTPKAGDRIRFLKTLTQGPTDETPPFLFARRGELGTIESVGDCREGYKVFWDGWSHASFGCDHSEFELVETE